MDFTEVYKMIKENRDNNFFNITGGEFNINDKDTNGYSLLHYAVQANDQGTTKVLLRDGIIYNNKNNDGKTPEDMADMPEIKDLLQTCKLFFKQVKAGSFHDVSNSIMKEKFLVNIKEEGAFSPLHWAANNCQEDVVRLLLQNGANIIQFTDKGNTPLHIAVSKKSIGIAELLLKSSRPNELLQLVNAQTHKNGSTCLHIAAKNGCFEIIKLLLKYGAIYDIMNVFNNTPFNFCKTEKERRFLQVMDDLFTYAENGNSRLIDELNEMEISEFEALTNAQNYIYHTLLQELTIFNHKNIADKLLILIERNNKIVKKQWKIDELNDLKYYAEVHCDFSKIYINMLRDISRPDAYDVNKCQWKTLKEGSYYLRNAYKLISCYKKYKSGSIEDENMLIIDATLKKFQFDIDHISFAIKDQSSIFASKAKGHEYYYKFLHSELKTDIRHFIKIVENNIDKPVKQFLVYIEQQKLHILINMDLMESIKEENYLAVCECIRKGANVNFVNDIGESSLQQAIEKGNAKIVKILLDTGADATYISSLPEGNTFLHFASTLDIFCKQKAAPLEIIMYLLQHGAIYNATNNDGRTAKDISNFPSITTLLQNIDTCFRYAEDDNADIFLMLQNMKTDEFRAATQTRSRKGYTLLQTAISTKHKNIENVVLNILQVVER